MANPPPPYANVTGISRADMKDNSQETLGNYNGNARPGELVVDLTTYQLYIGNSDGNLNIVTGGGNGSPGGSNSQIQYNSNGLFAGAGDFTYDAGANTLSIPDTIATGNIIPSVSNVYSLGSSTNQWKDMYVSANTIYINNVPLSGNSTGLNYDNQPIVIASNTAPAQTSNIATTAAVVAGNIVISNTIPGGGIVFPDGTTQTTAAGASNYGNANVAANLAAFATNPISTSGNITGGYILGNGALLTGIAASYGNANVAANLAAFATNPISTSGNITAGFFVGNGSALTGLPASYSDANVSAYLAGGTDTANIVTTGNISASNLLTSGVVSATGSVTAASVVTTAITGTSVTISATGPTQNVVLSATGNINATGAVINNVGAPLQSTDAATKAYVDANASGLVVIAASQLATAAALPAYTYNNGTAGVGATITATANGALTVDGTAATTGDRILVKNETAGNAPYNGVYTVTDPGSAGLPFVLTRATDNDQAADLPGAYTLVTGGSTNANTGWSQSTAAPIVIGTTAILWSQFSSQTSYTAGNGLSLVGTTFNVVPDGATTVINGSNQIAVKPSANLVTPNIGAATFSTLTATAGQSGNIAAGNITVTGNIAAGYFAGNGATLSDILGSNVTGFVANATLASTANVATLAYGVALANVTGAGNIASINLNGNVSTVLAGDGTWSTPAGTYNDANVSAYLAGGTDTANIITTGNVSGAFILGNISAATGFPAAYGDANVATYLASNANVVITTTGNITTTANVTADYLIGNGSQLTGLPAGYTDANVSTYLASGNNTAGYATTGNVTADTGEFTQLQTPVATLIPGISAQVYSTTALGFQATVSVQYGDTLGAPTSVEMLQVLAAQDAGGNVSYTVFNRVTTDSGVTPATVIVTSPSAGTITLAVDPQSNAYVSCSATRF